MASTPKQVPAAQPSPTVIVEEVLSAVLSPKRMKTVLDDACRLAGLAEVPSSPVSLRVFVEGALFSTLSRQLGIGYALDLGEQIRGALALALSDEKYAIQAGQSDIRMRTRRSAGSTLRVLVVSRASLVVFLLQDMLGEDVEVLPISSGAELEDRLRRQASYASLIVVDRKHPCVDPEIAAVLKRHAPESTVVWWGAHGSEREDVEMRLYGGPKLIPTQADMDLADLGELCRGVIELL